MIQSPFNVSEIVDSPSKLAILRVFASRAGLKATGREIAKLSGYSAPSTHQSLKDLNARHILKLEVIGKQHIYTLNEEDRIVKKIIRPLFAAEGGVKEEIRDFLTQKLKETGLKQAVVSLILYGSVQKDQAGKKSDVDVAVVTAKSADVSRTADVFVSAIMGQFKSYFGVQLDPYIKSAVEFRGLLKKNRAPVSTLIKSYTVLYGKEPLDI